jgi:hypothetical protein
MTYKDAFIDTGTIKDPRYAWLKAVLPDHVTVTVSSGNKDKKAVEFDRNRNLECLRIIFNDNVSPTSEIPFRTKLEPLYKK